MSNRNRGQQSPDTSIRAGELLDGKVDKANRANRELSEATRLANETLKGVQSAVKTLEAILQKVADKVCDEVGGHIAENVKEQLGRLDSEISVVIEKKTNRILDSFEELSASLYGENRQDGRPSVPDMVDIVQSSLNLKWPIFLNYITAAVEVSKGCGERDYGCRLPVAYAILAQVPHEGEKIESHIHLCEKHTADLREKGVILKTVKLTTSVCPWPHNDPGLTDEDFLEEK